MSFLKKMQSKTRIYRYFLYIFINFASVLNYVKIWKRYKANRILVCFWNIQRIRLWDMQRAVAPKWCCRPGLLRMHCLLWLSTTPRLPVQCYGHGPLRVTLFTVSKHNPEASSSATVDTERQGLNHSSVCLRKLNVTFYIYSPHFATGESDSVSCCRQIVWVSYGFARNVIVNHICPL